MTKEQGEALIKFIEAAVAVPQHEMMTLKDGKLCPVIPDYDAALTARGDARAAFLALLP